MVKGTDMKAKEINAGNTMNLAGRCGAWLAAALLAGTAYGNNIEVRNVSWHSTGGGVSDVHVDLAWENSWRATWTEDASTSATGAQVDLESWDAAWVFVKYRAPGGTWLHATLSTNKADHTVPPGAALDVGVTAGRKANNGSTPGEGVGVFIYRAAEGNGTLDLAGVKLRWLHGADTVPHGLDLQVHAVEMVYVPEGAFRVGTGTAESGSFKAGDTAGSFLIDATWSGPTGGGTARQIGNAAGKLWGYTTGASNATIGPEGELHNNYPTGYSAFYCMKYEITQGQYAAFLTASQYADWQSTMTYRNSITQSGTAGAYIYSASKPYVACNWLAWAHAAAYKAWAGLRPMTELEFEKACRGARKPVAGEYAWGSTAITQATNFVNDGAADERALPSGANAAASGVGVAVNGPLRAGVFATATSGRAAAGASYWGIMELSGNLFERAVGVASNSAGNETKPRDFQGTHGAGSTALPADWPQTDAIGAGFRGGRWSTGVNDARVSDRALASPVITSRANSYGSRGVRSAP
jgi:formylglycine-generating enzyme required for sulfatase activity